MISLSNESKTVIKLIDSIVRGNRGEINAAEDFAKHLFQTSLTLKRDESLNEDQRSEQVNFAVGLYNRIRNIPASAKAEVFKAYLKAVVAKYLVVFCSSENTIKAMSKSILLLARAGMDLIHNPYVPESVRSDAVLCFGEVTRMWADIPESALLKVISPIETENLRIAVYQTEVCLAESLQKDLRQAAIHLRAASNLIRNMPSETKLEFSKRCTTIALKQQHHENGDLSLVADILRYALVSVDMVKPDDPYNIRVFSMKQKAVIVIAMLHVFQEMKDSENSLSCAQLMEKLMVELKSSCSDDKDVPKLESQCLCYKLKLHLSKGEYLEAEELIRMGLIKMDTHQLILQGVVAFTNAVSCVHHDMFQSLLQKFPDDHFICTQLAYLRSMILHDSSDEAGYNRSLQLCISVVENHISRFRTLTEGDHCALRSIMLERVKYFHSQEQFEKSFEWVALLEHLVEHAEDREYLATVLLLKAEALYCLENYTDSLATVNKLIQRELSTRAIVMLFKVSLKIAGAVSAVNTIKSKISAFPNIGENLERLEFCISVADEAKDMDAIDLLYIYYIQTYCGFHGWEQNNETTLAQVLCDYSDSFRRRYMRENNGLRECDEIITKRPRLDQIYQPSTVAGSNLNNENTLDKIGILDSTPLKEEYALLCDAAAIKSALLPPAQSLINLLGNSEIDLQTLGSPQDFTWYSNFLWNVAVSLANSNNNCERDARLSTAAQLLEVSSVVSERLVATSDSAHRVCTSLIVASALRLDMASGSDDTVTQTAANMDRVFHFLRISNTLDGPLYRLALVLEFGAKLRVDKSEADKFITRKKSELLGLSGRELIFFASLCMKEPNGTVIQAEEFLRLALQQCN